MSEEKVRELELKVNNLEHEDARIQTALDVFKNSTTEKFEAIKARLDKIEGARAKLAWIVIGVVAAAVVKFIISGGLTGV